MKCKRRFMHGKRRRRSPFRQDVTAYTTDPTAKKKSDKYATTKSDHPKFIGGSAPNPAKSAVNIAKTIYQGVKKLVK